MVVKFEKECIRWLDGLALKYDLLMISEWDRLGKEKGFQNNKTFESKSTAVVRCQLVGGLQIARIANTHLGELY